LSRRARRARRLRLAGTSLILYASRVADEVWRKAQSKLSMRVGVFGICINTARPPATSIRDGRYIRYPQRLGRTVFSYVLRINVSVKRVRNSLVSIDGRSGGTRMAYGPAGEHIGEGPFALRLVGASVRPAADAPARDRGTTARL
jgi:hypothetical protein